MSTYSGDEDNPDDITSGPASSSSPESKPFTFAKARAAYQSALAIESDLPDGMATELRDAATTYRETKDREGFAEDIQAIFDSWGMGY